MGFGDLLRFVSFGGLQLLEFSSFGGSDQLFWWQLKIKVLVALVLLRRKHCERPFDSFGGY